MTRVASIAGAFAGLLIAAPVAAQVPSIVPYQGFLADEQGAYDGEVTLTFRLYAGPDAPSPLWQEQWVDVPVEAGAFYVYLGMMNAIAPAISGGEATYLGVSIEGEGEASPRQRLGSVPYAMRANDADTLGGYAADDFATEDWVRGQGYTTQQWVRDQGYTSQQWVRDQGYATQAWVFDQGFTTTDWVREWVGEQGFTTQQWVRDWVGEQGFTTAQWVRDWVAEQGFTTAQWVRDQGYLGADALDGYATEEWVSEQGYASEQWVRDQGYVTAAAVGEYATEQWVRDQGYLDDLALDGYATEVWVAAQGYLTSADLDGRGYVDAADLAGYVTTAALDARGYVTGAALDARGYLTGDALNGYVTTAALDARGYVSTAALDARGYVSAAALDARGYVTTAALDARGYLRAGDLDGYVTTAALDARGYVSTAALDARGYVTTAALDARDYATSAQVAALAVELNALRGQVGGRAYLLGRSNQTSSGRFSFGGRNGLRAATAMCQATYPNEPTAHFCTASEVTQAIISGSFDGGAVFDGVATWTIGDNAYSAARGSRSLGATCENLLYNSADVANGTRLTVRMNYQSPGNGGGVRGDIVLIEQEVACNTTMPVLCCR